MGHKVNPKAFRIGVIYGWDSRWFAGKKSYKEFVLEDAMLRTTLLSKLQQAGVTQIEIERSINTIKITAHVVRPGMVIGRGGQGMEELKKYVQELIINHRTSQKKHLGKQGELKLELRVEPVKEPNLSAYFTATQIAEQLARRMPHKRVVHSTMEKVRHAGAKGVKIILSGRINGAEISRRETYKTGSVPLSTLRELVDFAAVPSLTKSGYIGVKVWICR